MNRTFWKDTLRLIKNNKGRYFSFVMIVLIGTAFYTGVTASSTMMAQNVDAYNDSMNLKDITIYSNLGFDEDDIAAIEALENVEMAEGSKFVDVFASDGTTTAVTRIHSLSPDAKINQFVLVDGRYPENDREVLSEAGNEMNPGYAIGSEVTLTRPDEDLADWIDTDTVTVVGTIDTPLYLNMTKENSTLGNQYIDTYLYLNESAFVGDYDMEVNLVTTGGKSYNSFYAPYLNYIETAVSELEELSETQTVERRQGLVDEAMEQYNEGLKEYEEGLETYNREIADAEEQLSDAQEQLEEGRKTLADAEKQIADGYEALNKEQTTAQKEIDDGWIQYEQGLREYEQGLQEFEATKTELSATEETIFDGIEQIDGAISRLTEAKEGHALIEDGLRQIEDSLPLLENSSSAISLLLEIIPPAEQVTLGDLKQALAVLEAIRPDSDTMEAIEETLDQIDSDTLREYLDTIDRESLPEYLNTLLDRTEHTIDLFPQVRETYHNLSSMDWNDSGYLEQLGMSDENTLGELFTTLEEMKEELTETRATLLENKKLIEDSLAEEGLTVDGIDDKITELMNQRDELTAALEEISSGLASGEASLTDALEQLQAAKKELESGQETLNRSISNARAELAAAELELEDGKLEFAEKEAELTSALAEFEAKKLDGAQELEDAKAELDKALDEIQDLETCTWTILDRSKHYASETFKNTVKQMKSIADVFPVFFLLVASLVCLTTITRMVDEERGQLGIMRALGYTRFQCAFRYLFYSGTAAIIGCILGSIIGMITFPVIIYNAWKMMYLLPSMKIYISWGVIGLSSFAFFTVVILTTWFTCSKDMKDVPSQLLRPKAPKLGKATIIERIGFLWKRLSFTWKVTIRNLLRYKKRLLMTLVGVAGCTGLLIIGFGVKDSIQSMVDLQFDELQHYEGSAVFDEELPQSKILALADEISGRPDVEEALLLTGYSTLAASEENDLEETADLLVLEDKDQLSTIFTTRTRKGHDPVPLTDDGVIISEKLSENLGLSVGDSLMIESKNGRKRPVVISGICEMYIQHYVFMTSTYYTEIFGNREGFNEVIIKESESADNIALQTELLLMDGVASISFVDSVLENFQSMVNSLDLIVWVLIFSSMLLAFVVLGNLTNINISERQREIATLKVFGFRKKEVQSYIYKESNILTFFGALLGIPVGNYLHHYIMRQVEMDYIMFGRRVLPLSFLYSVVLTVAFGLLVNMFMRKRLAGVKMAESLKSVE